MKRLIVAAALLAVVLVPTTAPTSALGRGHCARDLETVTANLGKNYKEAPVAQGVNAAGALVQVWSTVDGKTWTLTIHIPNGPVCLLQAGTDWQTVPWLLPGAGA